MTYKAQNDIIVLSDRERKSDNNQKRKGEKKDDRRKIKGIDGTVWYLYAIIWDEYNKEQQRLFEEEMEEWLKEE